MGHDRAEEVALFRFQVIAEAAGARLSHAQRGLVVRALAEREWELPDGTTRSFSRATLDRWVRAYRAGGLDGLRPRPRADAGRARDDGEWLAEAARLRRELPTRSAAAIVETIGRAHGVWLSERTVRAHLARAGLSRAALGAEPARAFGRFEATRPNELWCADVLVGPFVPHPRVPGSRRARLFSLLDDYSRLVVHGRWGPEENARAGQDVLRAAVCRRGVPEALLVDNGAPFRARQLARTCAVLGTRLVFARPYHPATKGKLERFHRYVRERFVAEATAVGIVSFDELNDRWAAWSETVANHRTHAETAERPVDRFVAGGAPRTPDPATVFEAFRWSVSRRVSKTATVEFHGNRYGVDTSLVGLWVELRFDPEDLTRIDVYVEGRAAGAAIPFVVGRHVHAEVPQASPPPPPQRTGIDYLGLVTAAHEEATVGPIAYRDVALPGFGAGADGDDEEAR